jgi:hypothetical protein
MQKPYAPKCRHGKTKIDLFLDFLQKSPMSKLSILFQLKFPRCINIQTCNFSIPWLPSGEFYLFIILLKFNKYVLTDFCDSIFQN